MLVYRCEPEWNSVRPGLEVPDQFIEHGTVGAEELEREEHSDLPASAQWTVNTSTLLFPPLVQPRSPVLPLGVCTMTFT